MIRFPRECVYVVSLLLCGCNRLGTSDGFRQACEEVQKRTEAGEAANSDLVLDALANAEDKFEGDEQETDLLKDFAFSAPDERGAWLRRLAEQRGYPDGTCDHAVELLDADSKSATGTRPQ